MDTKHVIYTEGDRRFLVTEYEFAADEVQAFAEVVAGLSTIPEVGKPLPFDPQASQELYRLREQLSETAAQRDKLANALANARRELDQERAEWAALAREADDRSQLEEARHSSAEETLPETSPEPPADLPAEPAQADPPPPVQDTQPAGRTPEAPQPTAAARFRAWALGQPPGQWWSFAAARKAGFTQGQAGKPLRRLIEGGALEVRGQRRGNKGREYRVPPVGAKPPTPKKKPARKAPRPKPKPAKVDRSWSNMPKLEKAIAAFNGVDLDRETLAAMADECGVPADVPEIVRRLVNSGAGRETSHGIHTTKKEPKRYDGKAPTGVDGLLAVPAESIR